MLRTSTRFFNLNFVPYTLYFISLFNLLSWSFHGVQAAPVHVSVGPEEREIGVFSKAPGHNLATVAGQIYAFKKFNGLHHVARDSGLDDNIVSASDATSAMSFTSTGATAIPSSPLDSSMSTLWTSSSTTSSCTPVVSSSSSWLEIGGTDGPTSLPIPAWTSPVMLSASSVTTPSFPPTVLPSVTTAETGYSLSSPVLTGSSPATRPASQETFSVTGLSLSPGVLPSMTTVVSDCPSSLSIPGGPFPVTPPASSDIPPPTTPSTILPSATPVVTGPPILTTTEGLPPVMPPVSSETPIITFPPIITSLLPPIITSLPPPIITLSSPIISTASSTTTTSQSAASPATATSPAGRPTSTVIVSVTPITPEQFPTTTSTSSAPNAQSNPSSQQTSSSPTSSPSAQSDAMSSPQLSGSLIAIITVSSFLGAFSLVLGVIVFFRLRHRRITQTRFLEEERQPSPPNLSSRFSVSTTGSMEQSRRFTLFNSRPPTARSLLPRPTNPNDGVTSATTPLVYFQGLPDDGLGTE